ncbi:MAG: type II secretion system protein [Phycisphaerales bacterium]
MNKHVRLIVILILGAIATIIALNYQQSRFSSARKAEVLEDLSIISSYRVDREAALRILDESHARVFPRYYSFFGGWGFKVNEYRDALVDDMKDTARQEGREQLLEELDFIRPFNPDA